MIRGLLITLLFIPSIGACKPETDAVKTALRAAYKQSKYDEKVKKKFDKLKKEIPKEVIDASAYIIPIARIFIENKLEYEWKF